MDIKCNECLSNLTKENVSETIQEGFYLHDSEEIPSPRQMSSNSKEKLIKNINSSKNKSVYNTTVINGIKMIADIYNYMADKQVLNKKGRVKPMSFSIASHENQIQGLKKSTLYRYKRCLELLIALYLFSGKNQLYDYQKYLNHTFYLLERSIKNELLIKYQEKCIEIQKRIKSKEVKKMFIEILSIHGLSPLNLELMIKFLN